MPILTKKKSDFESLDGAITQWLKSDTVFQIIIELNKKYGSFGEELSVMPRLIHDLAIGRLKPENFANELDHGLPYLEPNEIAEIIEVIKQRVLSPLRKNFKSKCGFDTENVSTEIQKKQKVVSARTMTIEGGLGKIVHPSAPAPVQKTPAQVLQEEQQLRARTMSVEGQITDPVKLAQKAATEKAQAAAASAQAEQLRARTMEIQGSFAPVKQAPKPEAKKMVDITKPVSVQGSAPTAQVTNIQGSLSPIERAGQAPAPVKAPTPPPVKKPEQKADELETTAPIGLSEVVPQAPTGQPSWPAEPEVVRAEPIKPTQPISDPSLKQSAPIEVPKPAPSAPLPAAPLPKAAGTPAPHDIAAYRDAHPAPSTNNESKSE